MYIDFENIISHLLNILYKMAEIDFFRKDKKNRN
ncbi:hypothetical protein BPO_0796 [Bergeyella porcorum]|uniref:Uncharacterized protein n=1 Tax=Bergeyella porcorum TaxID=1735111 RepID=A0AAU0F0I8_9FLAO